MGLSLVTAAVGEPITLEQAKRQVELQGTSDHDAFLLDLVIPAARERAEIATQRQLLRATWNLTLDRFPWQSRWIELPRPNLIDVLSVTYVDTAGTTQTWASSNYHVDAPSGPRPRRGRLALTFGGIWPITQDRINAVTIQFRAGYGTSADSVPPLLRQGMLFDIGMLFEYRESLMAEQGIVLLEVPGSARNIYQSFKSHPSVCL